ncbi:MAG: YcxB family protein [Tissierellia bacterium]|nr:YcxB family protein [Tissierellia bacterium]
MNKTFIYTPEEFRRGMRKAIGLSGAIGKVDFIIFPLIFIASFFVPNKLIATLVRIISLLGIIGLVYQLWLLPKKTLKNTSYYQEDYDIYFGKERISVMNMNGESEYRYGDFDEITMDREFLFFKKDRSFIFIPLRIFAVHEKEDLEEILNPYMKKNRGEI